MKRYFFIATIVFLVILISCTKNNTPSNTVKTETPIQSLVNNKFLDSISIRNEIPLETGYRFSSSKNGHITKIGCYLPQNLPYKVTLWDSATKQILTSITIEVADFTKFTYKNITPVPIEANKTYVISVNTCSSFDNNTGDRTGGVHFILCTKSFNKLFPIHIGTITIARSMLWHSIIPIFPAASGDDHYLAGIPDFVFEPTE